MEFSFDQTICAPATVPGTGAVSMIRVSGSDSLSIADKVVRFAHGTALSAKGYSLKYGTIFDGGEVLDDVVVAVFRAPHSYTGEDSVEISCHASGYICGRILDLLCEAGARPAEPGEFTRRAFVNGKMDLAQAEAVADVIASASKASHRVAFNQLKGGYSAELKGLREQLLDLSSLVELELDFSEEDVEFADRSRLSAILTAVLFKIDALVDSFRAGNAIKNGVPVAIVGAANSGKSTLLNALLGEERAIVTDIAGTTRDTVEETMTVDGLLYRFIDTAGLRDTEDIVEKIGIERSLDALKRADVVILVLDSTSDKAALKSSFEEVSRKISEEQTLIVVYNKVDAVPSTGSGTVTGSGTLTFPELVEGSAIAIAISAKNRTGLDDLRSALSRSQAGRFAAEQTYVTNQRHVEALRTAAAALRQVESGIASGIATDLLAEDLRAALRALGAITGEIETDEILGNIFRKFCIGK